jgi:hypothetical protein
VAVWLAGCLFFAVNVGIICTLILHRMEPPSSLRPKALARS